MQAIASSEQVLKKDPQNIEALELLGDAYAVQGNWAKSKQHFETLKKLKPAAAEYEYKYGGALGMIAKNSNKFKALGLIPEIRKSFENAIKLDPKHIDARWALIELNLQLPAIVGGSQEEALQYADELLTLSPVDGHLAKGHISEHNKRYSDAEKSYKAAVRIGKSKTTYKKLSDLYKKMKQPQKAAAIMAEYQRLK